MSKIFYIFVFGVFIFLLSFSCFAQKKQTSKDEAVYTITEVDSSIFTFYYWYTAEKKTATKTEKVNIMSEKVEPTSSPENLIYIKEGMAFQNLKVEPLVKIKLDNDIVKTDEMIYMVDGKAISGAGKIYYTTKCFEKSFIRKDCYLNSGK